MMLERIIGNEDDDQPGYVDPRIKPALLTLLYDQAALLDASVDNRPFDHDLRGGFPHTRALIEWYQSAAVRTVGFIEEYWHPIDCVSDSTLLSALIVHPEPEIDPRIATVYRHLVEVGMVQPACVKAYQKLRGPASEYIGNPDDWESESPSKQDLDPTVQKHVAMRPGFQTLDAQQQRALDALWGGFHTYNDLLDWALGLTAPSNGEIGPEFSESIMADETAMDRLLHDPDTERARLYREALAAAVILPSFVKGVRETDTGELAAKKQEAPTTLRQKGGVTYE